MMNPPKELLPEQQNEIKEGLKTARNFGNSDENLGKTSAGIAKETS